MNQLITVGPPLRPRRRLARPVGGLLFTLSLLGVVAWPVREARDLQITNTVARIPGLPPQFAGLRIALIADVHRGPFMSERRIFQMVHAVNAEKPDVIALAGDYVHRNRRYIPSVWKELGGLRAPSGVYAVLGNHDHWESTEMSFRGMAHAGITNLTNRNARLERDGAAVYIAGVDDSWAGQPDLPAALAGVGPDEVAVLISHNPDYVEEASDPRAKLWLSGHTHGGQVCLPGGKPLVHPSKYGECYLSGLNRCRDTQIYTTRGVGTVTPPVRWNCPAEVPIIELQPG